MNRNKLMLTTTLLVITFVLGASLTMGEVRPTSDYLSTKIQLALVSEAETSHPAHLYMGQRRCTETTEHLLTVFSDTEIRGTLDYPDGGVTKAEATLKIYRERVGEEDIQKFTLTSGATTISGWLSARTTCGYTGVTITFPEPVRTSGDYKKPIPQPTIISMAACKQGGRFKLTGKTARFDFLSDPGQAVVATPQSWGRYCTIKGEPK